MDKTIFCIMGPSGSGKNFIMSLLEGSKFFSTYGKYFYPMIECTNRPRRMAETNGVHYYFYDEGFDFENNPKFCAVYHSGHKGWDYAIYQPTIEEERHKDKSGILFTNPTIYRQLKENTDYHIYGVILWAPLQQRIIRSAKRAGIYMSYDDLDEIYRRACADKQDFGDLNQYEKLLVLDNSDNEGEATVRQLIHYLKFAEGLIY